MREYRLPQGVVVAAPVLLPTAALGAAFGVLAEPLMGSTAPIVMSCLVFGGSAQFAALGVLTAGGGVTAAALAGALTNMRFLVTGFAVAPCLRGGRVRRALEGQAVVDTSFALAGRGDGTFDRGLLLWSGATQFAAWVSGTVAGVALASRVPDPYAWGLDVVMPAFFLTLLVSELRRHWVPAVTVAMFAAGIAVLATLTLPAGAPVGVAALACLLGLTMNRPRDETP